MATWITDRTQADIDRVKEIAVKARTGIWTEEEQQEWAAGMKGALSYTDYNRIENGIKELAEIVGADYSARIVQKSRSCYSEKPRRRYSIVGHLPLPRRVLCAADC